ncbi:MAG: hypothetical protein WCJ59_00675 [bacterium]
MSQVMFNVMMFAILIGIFGIIALAFVGVLTLIGKVFWAIYLKFDAAQRAKIQKLWFVMEKAASMSLPEAINLLRDAGIYYDVRQKCIYGKHIKLPKCFWKGDIHPEIVSLKSSTLITIVTWALDNNVDKRLTRITAEVPILLLRQVVKTPNMVMAVESRIVQQIVGNTKLAAMLKQFDRHNCTWY